MKGIYIYHSGFALLDEGGTVIIDYYKDSADRPLTGVVHGELLSRPGKLYVLASHVHADHFNPEVLTWKEMRSDIQYLFSKDILENGKAGLLDACYLDKGNVWTDGVLEVEAFGSTDAGVSFLLRWDGKTIFHAGDLNNWHWMDESTEAEWKGAEKNFLHELDDLYAYTPEVDVAMFPVDPRLGKEYMRGAGQFVTKIKTHIFVPMHFTPEYAKANAFRDFAEAHGVRFVSLTHRGQKIEIE